MTDLLTPPILYMPTDHQTVQMGGPPSGIVPPSSSTTPGGGSADGADSEDANNPRTDTHSLKSEYTLEITQDDIDEIETGRVGTHYNALAAADSKVWKFSALHTALERLDRSIGTRFALRHPTKAFSKVRIVRLDAPVTESWTIDERGESFYEREQYDLPVFPTAFTLTRHEGNAPLRTGFSVEGA